MILALAVREPLPYRRASSFAVLVPTLLGVALILAAFRVDVQSQEKAGPGRLQPAQTYAATPTGVPSPVSAPDLVARKIRQMSRYWQRFIRDQ